VGSDKSPHVMRVESAVCPPDWRGGAAASRCGSVPSNEIIDHISHPHSSNYSTFGLSTSRVSKTHNGARSPVTYHRLPSCVATLIVGWGSSHRPKYPIPPSKRRFILWDRAGVLCIYDRLGLGGTLTDSPSRLVKPLPDVRQALCWMA